MKLRALFFALSLLASACTTSNETHSESGEAASPSSSLGLQAGNRQSAALASAAARELAFGLHHQDRIQYQVRSTIHGSSSTTLEIFVANGERKLLVASDMEFALEADGKGFVRGESELPWIFENYQTLWVEFPIATTVNSDLSLQITTREKVGELSIGRSAPALPKQINPLTEPLPHGFQIFGPSTFELRSIAFGESSITAHMFAANQTELPMGVWFDSRIIDDLGNGYSMMLSPSGEYFSAEATTGVVVSASFAGRIHPDATELILIVDHPLKPLIIENLDLDMPQKLVPALPAEDRFDGESIIDHWDISVSGDAVTFGSDWTEVALEITNNDTVPHGLGISVEVWLADDLGNRHKMIMPKGQDDFYYMVESGTSVNGVFRFAGGVSPNAQRRGLWARHYTQAEQLVSEIALTRVGEPSEPDTVLIRRFSRYVPVSFGESSATSELLEALATEVHEGVVELELPDDVLFEFAKSDLSSEGIAVLADVAELLGRSTESAVSVTGHTDAIGTVEANLALSIDRAEAVRWQLVEVHGIDPARLTVRGLGESQPIANEFDASGADSPEGRARNRRTEIRIDGFDG